MPHRDPALCLTPCSPAGGPTRPGPGRPTRPPGGHTRPVSNALFFVNTPLASRPSICRLVGTNLLFLGARTPPGPSWRRRRIPPSPAHPCPFFYKWSLLRREPASEPETTSSYLASSSLSLLLSLFVAVSPFSRQAWVGHCRACNNPMHTPFLSREHHIMISAWRCLACYLGVTVVARPWLTHRVPCAPPATARTSATAGALDNKNATAT